VRKYTKKLHPKAPLKKHKKKAWCDLLKELSSYSGTRKCRPYELFLFAAQNKLEVNRLEQKRSTLNPECDLNAPYALQCSIMEAHKGMPF